MVVGIHTAGDGKPEQVQAVEAVFAGHRVAVCQQIPDFAAAYACFQIELSGQCLCREFFFGHMCQHFGGIHKYGMAACGTLVGYPVLIQFHG